VNEALYSVASLSREKNALLYTALDCDKPLPTVPRFATRGACDPSVNARLFLRLSLL